MDVKILNNAGNELSFMVKGTDNTFMNTLRRMILDEVPTMAIEWVDFKKNDSVMYDEMVALRLGLVPLKTDLKAYTLPERCSCKGEGCAKCQVALILKTKASGMIETDKLKSKDPATVPVYDTIPLTFLEGEQELEFMATAQLGKGKVHAKWSPAHVWFVREAKVTVNNASSQLAQCKNRYPPQIMGSDGKIDVNKINTQTLIDACDGVCDDVVKVEYHTDSFVLYLESWGQLTQKEIVETAVVELLAKLEEFKILVEKLA